MEKFIHRYFRLWAVVQFFIAFIVLIMNEDMEVFISNLLIAVCLSLISISYGKENKD